MHRPVALVPLAVTLGLSVASATAWSQASPPAGESAPALKYVEGSGAPKPYAPLAPHSRIVYRKATLIDGAGGATRPNMAIVIDGATIKAVLPDRELDAATLRVATTINLDGLYVLPGLIDSHVHLATPPERKPAEAMLRRNIYSGVTAVRDMADDLRAVGDLARASLVGELPGPDIYYAALMAGPTFFEHDPRTSAVAQGAVAGAVPWMQAISERTDIALAVATARGTYATGIKLYADMSPPLVSKVTAEAHRIGMPVWAHATVAPTLPSEMVAAGVDVLSHACMLAYQVSDRRPPSDRELMPVDYAKFAHGDNAELTRVFEEMHRRGVILDATNRYYFERDKQAAADSNRRPKCSGDLSARLTAQAYRHGVLISAGTDSEASPESPFAPLYEEMSLLAEKAGMPPAQVIRAATLVSAMAMGRQNEMGTIEPGKLANLMVVAQNPLEDLHNLRSVVFTVKRGRTYMRADYRPISKDELPTD